MTKFVELIAPHGAADWLLKYACIAMAIVGMNVFAFFFLANRPVELIGCVVMPLTVGTPFILLALASVSHMAKLQAALHRQAVTDHLTGLPNRRAFLEAEQTATAGVVLVTDIDWFKSINDRFGHNGGDRCLVLFAEHLRRTIRDGDMVARIGGEEFAVLLHVEDPDMGRAIGERISRGITLDPDGMGRTIHVSASVGMAAVSPGNTISEALMRADAALYCAKRNGRARVVDAGRTEAASEIDLDLPRPSVGMPRAPETCRPEAMANCAG